MRGLGNFLRIFAIWLISVAPALAQDDDKGFLTRAIQNALSGAGRTVDIDGFKGALSSAASFDQMTIADQDGIWLTLIDVELEWNRSALLRGRIEVESLTAKRLDVPRLPLPDKAALPTAEAKPFALPDLPVSIEIDTFAVEQINLGAPLVGEQAQLSVTASAEYTNDVANLNFQAQRTDGTEGQFAIKVDFERGTSALDLLVKLSEGAKGIAARLLNIPDQPSVDLSVQGTGLLDDFTADVLLATDGQQRLAGEISLGVQTPRRASDKPERRITADIGGDITAILAPRYREFFGTDVSLTLDALVENTGAIEVSSFTLDAQAATLEGRVTLNQDKWPTLLNVRGTVANPDGTTVLLPVGGDGTTVERVGLQIDFDAANGDALRASFDIAALSLGDVKIDETELTLDGTLTGKVGSIGKFAGDVGFAAKGLFLANAAMSEAIGDQISGQANVTFVEDAPLTIRGLTLTGTDYGLTGDAVINGLETGLNTQIDLALNASDLSRFSALVGREIAGQSELTLTGDVGVLSGQFNLRAGGSTRDLRTGISQADAVLAGVTRLGLQALRNENGTFLRDLVLKNDALDLTGKAELRTDNSRTEAQFVLSDIGLVLQQYNGPVTVDAIATQDSAGWHVDASTDGPYHAKLTVDGLATGPNAVLDFTTDVPDVSPFAEGIDGPVKASGSLRQTPQGWRIRTDATGPYEITAAVEGLVTPTVDVQFDLALPDVNPLVPQVNGPLEASGTLRQTSEGWQIKTDATGPYQVQAAVEGLVAPRVDVRFDLKVPNLNPVVPQINGPAEAVGTLRQTDQGFVVDTTANGPYGARAVVEGLATGPNMSLTFDVSVPNVAPLAPGINGPLSANGVVRQSPKGISVAANAAGPYSAQATVDGVVTGPNAAVDFNVSMPNVGVLVDKINGPLRVDGSARKAGDGWQVDTNAIGPSGTQANIAGRVNGNGTLNLDITGNAPLGLSQPFLKPRDLQGQVRFDLNVNGPAALSSVSGTIQTSGATLTAPNLRFSLRNMDADIRLERDRAQIGVTADAVNGGQVRMGGAITLTPSLPADLQIGLQNLVLLDPKLYRTTVNGTLRVAGPLTGGALISGQIDAGETNVNVPSTGLTAIGEIPPITQVNAPADVITTRRKAGIDSATAGDDPTEKSSGPGYQLNLRVNAPGRIFVRGRGLDAELGGNLTLTGTTNRIISAGQFQLLRGRLNILGKRFDLVQGTIQFQGDLIPYIRFVSATATSTGEVRVVVEGRADAPEVRFEATPEAPQDEVLAQLLFGRNLADISAFQALQLASAVATLAGRGGTGVISNLREGFGLDDLDVTTTDTGATAIRAGKYLSENIYSDVTAASDGTGEISLNLDISPNLTGKATLGSDGNTGIGIFFEKDY